MQGGLIPLNVNSTHPCVLQFHGVPNGHPPLGLGNMKETMKNELKVDKLALDVHWKPTVAHVLGCGEGGCLGPWYNGHIGLGPVEV